VTPAGAAGQAGAGPIETEILDQLARAAPGGLRIEHATLPSDRVARLRVLRGGAPAATDADRVVLLHGRGHAASVWFPCWPALAARHRLLAPDLPGFGASEGGDGPRADAEGALGFFTDPVEAFLAAEVGVGQGGGRTGGLALVGHSLGALVALELALRGRLPVRRLVLIDGMGLGPEMTLASRLFFRLHPERLVRVLGAPIFGWLNPAPPTPLGRRVAALEIELLTARAPARAAAAQAFDRLCPLRGPAFHRGERLGQVEAPVLLLWGARDAALPVANATAAQSRLRDARTLTFAQAGHSPHLEDPDQALPPLLDFLAAGSRRG
jgi:pimeloyl-ACP methyl ester carboxylesterase